MALLVVAAALRAIALVAVYPGIWFSDTTSYVRPAATGVLSVTRVSGYSLVVAPFYRLGSAGALIVFQHLVGLAIVAVLYALLRRRGVSRPVAVLAVVPAALDAYLIDLEHMIMSETVFHAAVVGGLAVLLWRERPTAVSVACAGLLIGYAGVVRSVGIPIVAVCVLYLLLRRVGWRMLVTFCLAWALVAGGYATLFASQHGHLGFTLSGGRFLYAKVAPFADCSRLPGLPAGERPLCPDPHARMTPNGYMWGRASPTHGLPRSADPRIKDFATRVIRNRPVTYAHVVLRDLLHYFEPGHRITHGDYHVTAWQFPADPRHWGYPGYRGPIRRGSRTPNHRIDPGPITNRLVGRPRTNVSASRLLHDYQQVAFTPGPLLAVCVLLVLAALLLRRGALRLRLDAGLLAASALVALGVAAALSVFDYRYGLLAVLLMPPAAALAATALGEGRPSPAGAS